MPFHNKLINLGKKSLEEFQQLTGSVLGGVKSLGRKTTEEFKELTSKTRSVLSNEITVDNQANISEGVMSKAEFKEIRDQIETPTQQFLGPDPRPATKGFTSIAKGTNFDPFKATQTKPKPDGKGAAGVIMTDKMIAVSRLQANSREPIVPYGTIVSIDGEEFLVADIKNKRFFGEFQFDFARPHTGDIIIPELNRDFDFEIIELGKGRQDARDKAKRFQ